MQRVSEAGTLDFEDEDVKAESLPDLLDALELDEHILDYMSEVLSKHGEGEPKQIGLQKFIDALTEDLLINRKIPFDILMQRHFS